jgi:hypothetical protein
MCGWGWGRPIEESGESLRLTMARAQGEDSARSSRDRSTVWVWKQKNPLSTGCYHIKILITIASVADLGCLSQILNFVHPGSRIPDPKRATKEKDLKKISYNRFRVWWLFTDNFCQVSPAHCGPSLTPSGGTLRRWHGRQPPPSRCPKAHWRLCNRWHTQLRCCAFPGYRRLWHPRRGHQAAAAVLGKLATRVRR